MTAKISPDSDHAPQFLERMFSGITHPGAMRPLPVRPPSEHFYRPLRETKARPGASYRLQSQAPGVRVQAESRATDVMTDLRKVAAVVTRGVATVDEAHKAMIAHGVRALFVVDEQSTVLGIVTSTDILGERPVLLAQQRGVRYDEILVRDLMTPADLLETMSLDDVLESRVGDVVASLKASGRQHALVIESEPGAAVLMVRGIFSLTQIARQL
jgi:CBS-domain-containing membrane protein